MLPNAGKHVLQAPPLGRVVEHVAERDERDFVAGGERGKCRKAAAVIALIETASAKPDMAGEGFGERGEPTRGEGSARQHRHLHSLSPFEKV